MKRILRGTARTAGTVEAPAIVTNISFGFWQGIDPSTGIITNRRHPLYGQSIKDKVFVFPYGRGSTGNPGVFLEAVRNRVAPAAMINISSEPMIIVCSLLAEACYGVQIPVIDNVDRNPVESIPNGSMVKVDGTTGVIRIVSTPGFE